MLDIFGLFVLFITMVIQVIIPPIPAEAVVIGAAKIYPVWIVTLVAGAGLFVGSYGAYYLGNVLRTRCTRFFKKQKVRIVVNKLQHYGSLILWIRILPYNPSDIISYAAGVAALDKKKFVGITLVTSSVRCLILAALGTFIVGSAQLLQVIGILAVSSILASALVYKTKTRS